MHGERVAIALIALPAAISIPFPEPDRNAPGGDLGGARRLAQFAKPVFQTVQPVISIEFTPLIFQRRVAQRLEPFARHLRHRQRHLRKAFGGVRRSRQSGARRAQNVSLPLRKWRPERDARMRGKSGVWKERSVKISDHPAARAGAHRQGQKSTASSPAGRLPVSGHCRKDHARGPDVRASARHRPSPTKIH